MKWESFATPHIFEKFNKFLYSVLFLKFAPTSRFLQEPLGSYHSEDLNVRKISLSGMIFVFLQWKKSFFWKRFAHNRCSFSFECSLLTLIGIHFSQWWPTQPTIKFSSSSFCIHISLLYYSWEVLICFYKSYRIVFEKMYYQVFKWNPSNTSTFFLFWVIKQPLVQPFLDCYWFSSTYKVSKTRRLKFFNQLDCLSN